MVPETMSVRATQTLATGRDTDLHQTEHSVVDLVSTMSSPTNNPIIDNNKTLATGRDTDLHQTEHSVGMIDLVSTMSSRTNNPIIDNNKIKKKKKKN